jgi:hypothetical protein
VAVATATKRLHWRGIDYCGACFVLRGADCGSVVPCFVFKIAVPCFWSRFYRPSIMPAPTLRRAGAAHCEREDWRHSGHDGFVAFEEEVDEDGSGVL